MLINLFNGDSDGNNYVNSTDLGIVTNAMDSMVGDPLYNSQADLDGNGEVSSTDLSIVLGNMDKIVD